MSGDHVRKLAYWVVGSLSVAFLVGCGGSSSHTVATGTTGSLRGVDFVPVDHSLRVDTDANFRVYWHTGYTPPGQFIVSLKKVDANSDKEAVRTELNRVGEGYVWDLEPTGSLDGSTVYFIEVEAAPESEVSMFLTEEVHEDRSRAASPVTGEALERGEFEHVVTPTKPVPSTE